MAECHLLLVMGLQDGLIYGNKGEGPWDVTIEMLPWGGFHLD